MPPASTSTMAAATPANTSRKCRRWPILSRYANRMATIMLASMPSRRKITKVGIIGAPLEGHT